METGPGEKFQEKFQGLKINQEYSVVADGRTMLLKTRVTKRAIYNELSRFGISSHNFDDPASEAYSIKIAEIRERCAIDLNLFCAKQKDGRFINYLYISSRYVTPDLRGKKLGEQLLQIADRIAEDNECTAIFAQLSSRLSADKEKLIEGHKKLGYEISEGENMTLARKKIQK